MNFYIVAAKKRNWTNKAAREALNIGSDSQVVITKGNQKTVVSVRRAPAAAARVMRAVHNLTGMHGIALDSSAIYALGAKQGDKVEVVSKMVYDSQQTEMAQAQQARTTSSSSRPKVVVAEGGSGKPASLLSRMNGMKVGDTLEVSESQAKSGAYSVAKEAGIKIQKVGPTLIKRVS